MPMMNTAAPSGASCSRPICGDPTVIWPTFCTASDTDSIGSGNFEVIVALLPNVASRNAI